MRRLTIKRPDACSWTGSGSGTARLRLLLLCCVAGLAVAQGRPDTLDRPLEVHYRIQEGQAIGSRVGQLNIDSRLSLASQFTPAELNNLTYVLPRDSQYFHLDRTTSVISVKSAIDREALIRMFLENHVEAKTSHGIFCATVNGSQSTVYSQLECRFSFLTGVRSGVGGVKWVQVHVNVADMNDNAPSWYNVRWLNMSVPEQVPTGYCARLTPAVDQDFLQNGTVYYSIASPRSATPFELRQGSSSDELCVRVISALDREAKDHFQLTLVARDGGSPSQNTSVVLNVYIADDNDNPPAFNRSHEVRHVSEGQHFNTVVYTATAFDLDVGDRSRLKYAIGPSQDSHCQQAFRIDSETGELTVDGSLDRETRSACQLQISVWDGKFTGEQTLTVLIDDVNDNTPRIDVIQLPDSASGPKPGSPHLDLGVPTFEIIEHSAANANRMLVHVEVIDADDGNNGLISCVLEGSSDFRLDAHKNDTRNSITYTLSSGKVFDREEQAAYELSIRCRDSGDPPTVSRKNITVLIGDINDHAPEFTQHQYVERVRENNVENLGVLYVQATDADADDNARIEFSLNKTGVPRDVQLEINRDSGEIRLVSKLDREKHGQNVTFEVIARDFGSPRRSASVPVTLQIVDVNDHAPKFSAPQYRFEVREDAAMYTEVGRVEAADQDAESPNCDIEYFLQRSVAHSSSQRLISQDNDMFRVSPTGVILLISQLDYERVQSYTLYLVARDLAKDQHPQSAFASVQVDVKDVNDNDPWWHFPSNRSRVQNVSCHEPIGSVIAQLSAADDDSEENSNLLYSISHLTSGGVQHSDVLFVVNDLTGQVSVARALPCPSSSSVGDVILIKLVVNVTDRGDPPRSAASVVDIFLRNTPPMEKAVGSAGNSAKSESSMLPFNLSDQSVIIVLCAVLATLFTALVLVIVAACYKLRKPREEDEDDDYPTERPVRRAVKSPDWTNSAVYSDSEQICEHSMLSKRFSTLGQQRGLPSRPPWNNFGTLPAGAVRQHDADGNTKDSPCSLWRQVDIVAQDDVDRCRHISEETEGVSEFDYDEDTIQSRSPKRVIDLVVTGAESEASGSDFFDPTSLTFQRGARLGHPKLNESRQGGTPAATMRSEDSNNNENASSNSNSSGYNRSVTSNRPSSSSARKTTPRSTSLHNSRAITHVSHTASFSQKFSPSALHLALPQSLQRKLSNGSVTSTRSSQSDSATPQAPLGRSLVLAADPKTTRMRVYEAQSFKPVHQHQQHQSSSAANQTSTFV